MPVQLKPGSLSQFANSMAAEIENELNTLMTADGLPPMNMDASDQTVRDRRRLFVAIARGVVVSWVSPGLTTFIASSKRSTRVTASPSDRR